MKILLVNAATRPRGMRSIYPIQLSFLGGYLLSLGHEVTAVDLDGPENNVGQLDASLQKGPYDLIGVSYRNLPQAYWLSGFSYIRKLLSRLRPYTPLLIVGGAAFTEFTELLFNHMPEADAGIIGAGEVPLAAIAENPENFQRVPGVCFRYNNEIIINPRNASLAGEAFPPRRDIPGIAWEGYSSVAVQTYRGCPKDCPVCPTPYIHGDFQARPLNSILEELHFLYSRGVRHIFIIDPKFNLPWNRSNRFLDLLISENPGLTWEAFLRPDTRLSLEYLSKAKRAGCVRWHLEPLSGNHRWLNKLHSDLNPEVVYHTAKLHLRAKTEGVYLFYYNLPQETFVEEIDTIKMVFKLNRLGVPLNRMLLFPYFPFPNTPIANIATTNGAFTKKFWHIKRSIRYMTRPSTPFFGMFIWIAMLSRISYFGLPQGSFKCQE